MKTIEELKTYSPRLSASQREAMLIFYKYNIKPGKVAEFFSISIASVYYNYRRFKLQRLSKKETLTPEEALLNEGYI